MIWFIGFASVFLISLLFFYWQNARRHRPIKAWREQLNLSAHLSNFNALYAKVNGFKLSHHARIDHDRIEYIYGEIDFEGFIALLSLCPIDSRSVFYDLGSGCGKAVMACAMVFDMAKYCGIECLKPLHQAALEQLEQLKQNPMYAHRAQRIEFIQNDFLNEPLNDASIIFINSTAFFADHWQTISQYIEQVSSGTVIITSSKPLNSPLFQLERTTVVKMSWGLVKVYIQTKCEKEKQ